MKFLGVIPATREIKTVFGATFDDALRAIELEPGAVDHGVVLRSIDGRDGLGFVVYEWSMKEATEPLWYLGSRPYRGNALFYAFGPAGESVDLDEDKWQLREFIRWAD